MGTGLALTLVRAGWPLVRVWGRSDRGKGRARRLLGAPTTSRLEGALEGADLVLLGVSDDALAEMAARLRPWAAGRAFVHLSGCHGRDLLAPLAAVGGRTLAIHPLQTVPDPREAPARLAGACFTLVAEPADLPLARRLAAAAGGRGVPVPGRGRPLYHAAAVVACNELTALLDLAARLLDRATAGRLDLAALRPLVEATLAGAMARGPGRALTGPVARGDLEVIRGHLEALGREAPWALATYCRLGLETVSLARRAGGKEAELDRIERLLDAAGGS
jgi:predicted short-subunit dehydrogenase-like oxidoreductase (DUF2520 family)